MGRKRRLGFYIKQILSRVTLLVLLLEIDIAQRIHNKDLAVFGNDPLLGASRTITLSSRLGGGRARGRSRSGSGSSLLLAATATAAGGLLTVVLLLLLGVALLHPAHLAVHGDDVSVLVFHHLRLGGRRRRRRSGHRSRGGVDTGDVQVLTPSGMAGKLDVALDELTLALPAHVEGQVVGGAAGEEEDARDSGAQTGAVTVVVVLGALPRGEAVAEEVVVAVAHRPTQDVGDDGQAGLALRGALDGGLDLSGGGRLDHLRTRLAAILLLKLGFLLLGLDALGLELLLDLVRVQLAGLLLVGLVDVIETGGLADAEELVEGDVGPLVGDELVADSEDFAVYVVQRPC